MGFCTENWIYGLFTQQWLLHARCQWLLDYLGRTSKLVGHEIEDLFKWKGSEYSTQFIKCDNSIMYVWTAATVRKKKIHENIQEKNSLAKLVTMKNYRLYITRGRTMCGDFLSWKLELFFIEYETSPQ